MDTRPIKLSLIAFSFLISVLLISATLAEETIIQQEKISFENASR